MSLRLFTSESVTEGHPDKLADQISDAILDDLLRQDPTSRVAVETMLTTGLVHVGGEIRTKGYADIPTLVRDLVRSVGYTSSEASFDADTCGITSSIGNQSPEIAAGVDHAQEARDGDGDLDSQLGAGDQGIMFGFASNETPTYMPATAYAAHLLAQRLAEVRHSGELDYLLPDGKTQVTIGYDGYTPVTVETVVISTQHRASVTLEQLQADVRRVVIDPVIGTLGLDSSNMTVIINPAGPFTIGGPLGDAGLTGRKIIVDTYGGAARHGGGAFSGKDPSKVDRSAAYAMRWVAKNAVAAGLADRLEVQVAYAIGRAEPVGIYVEAFGTEHVETSVMESAIKSVFDLRPGVIIRELDLIRPIYSLTSTYGHFGRELPEFTWERTDRVEQLRAAAGL